MTPVLPSDAIRLALDSGRLDDAIALITQHELDVRTALGKSPASADDQDGWQALLSTQRSLLEQLQGARSDTMEALQRLQGNRRSAQAYRAQSLP
ncbi:hypothetical protein ACW7G0_09655 [Lysobacter sp. A286]